jgi:Amt family ammonium transporter
MVNITYGLISSSSNAASEAQINPYGTDMIVLQDDDTTLAPFDAGDIGWVLTCTALVWLMM